MVNRRLAIEMSVLCTMHRGGPQTPKFIPEFRSLKALPSVCVLDGSATKGPSQVWQDQVYKVASRGVVAWRRAASRKAWGSFN